MSTSHLYCSVFGLIVHLPTTPAAIPTLCNRSQATQDPCMERQSEAGKSVPPNVTTINFPCGQLRKPKKVEAGPPVRREPRPLLCLGRSIVEIDNCKTSEIQTDGFCHWHLACLDFTRLGTVLEYYIYTNPCKAEQ